MRASVGGSILFAFLLTGGAVASCSGDNTSPITTPDASPDVASTNDGTAGDGNPVDSGSQVDASNDPGFDAPNPATLVAFCDQTLGALVNAFEGCCSSGDKATAFYQFYDQVLHQLLTTCENDLSTSAMQGRITYDATAGQACINDLGMFIESAGCPSVHGNNTDSKPVFSFAPCTNVVEGLQGQGGSCKQDYDCQDGLTCVGWTGSSEGSCLPSPSSGSACGHGEVDGGGFFVDLGFHYGSHPDCSAGNYCGGFPQTCHPQQTSGAMCVHDYECASPLVCSQAQCGSGTPSAANGPCVDSHDCQDGLFCVASDAGAGTCQPREASGGSCTGGLFSQECKGLCEVPDASTVGQCAAFCGSG